MLVGSEALWNIGKDFYQFLINSWQRLKRMGTQIATNFGGKPQTTTSRNENRKSTPIEAATAAALEARAPLPETTEQVRQQNVTRNQTRTVSVQTTVAKMRNTGSQASAVEEAQPATPFRDANN